MDGLIRQRLIVFQCRPDITEILSPEEIQAIYAEFKAESNLIVLDQELFAPFMQNKFGVDVEVGDILALH